MQKRIFIFLFLIAAVLSYSSYAEAALQFLPRYQGSDSHRYRDRTQSGGKGNVEVTCAAIGGVAKGANQTCSGVFYKGGLTCYKSCTCSSGYKKNAAGTCVAQTCKDYGLESSPVEGKSCPAVSKDPNLTCYECRACDTNVYKYACSGALNATNQSGTACNSLYSECACVEHASWNSSTGKCECGSDYKAGSTSCTLKTCDDYGYSATEDKTKNCSKQTPRSGLECWNCSDCTGTLYDCGSITNASGGEGTACGGKYPSCSCKTGYFWDNGKCSLSCTAKSCTASTSCGGMSCSIFKPAAITSPSELGTGVGTYEACTPTNCSGDSYQYGYLPTGCAEGYVGVAIGSCAAAKSMDCAVLGYVKTSCSDGQATIKCPFDETKVFCLSLS